MLRTDTITALLHLLRTHCHPLETSSDLAIVLAMVLAHEAGQLLADHSHMPTGLMHASYMGASPQSWISHRTRRPSSVRCWRTDPRAGSDLRGVE
jgi:hypothetical protein